ncbi:MAG: metal-dependent hydrolase [Actinomycetota bacterium]|nr:metal-dependent hydrolase [Actinomycetota bacterium]
MSWAAHDLEPYALQRHLGGKVAIVPLLIGSYSPDMLSKWFVYGIDILGIELKADNPVQFHRGWPGVGFTHSLAFGVAVAALILLLTRSRIWSLSFLIGHWLHVVTDMGDTIGSMLFFPFSTETIGVGAWAYAGQTGRFTDAGAYFSGLGFAFEGIWVIYGLLSWRILRREYFREVIVKADPRFWGFAGRWFPESALLALYRASFFYGTTRWIAWLIWAHIVHDYAFDLSWGGPHWVDAAHD